MLGAMRSEVEAMRKGSYVQPLQLTKLMATIHEISPNSPLNVFLRNQPVQSRDDLLRFIDSVKEFYELRDSFMYAPTVESWDN